MMEAAAQVHSRIPDAENSPDDSPGDSLDKRQARRPAHVASFGPSLSQPALIVSVGKKFSSAVRAGDRVPTAFRIVSHAPVMLAVAQAAAASASGNAAARVVRAAAQQVVERSRLEILRDTSWPVVGTTAIARAVITLGSAGASAATLAQVHGATETLAATWVDGNQGGPSHAWVEPIMVGAAVLGAILEYLGVDRITAEAEAARDTTL